MTRKKFYLAFLLILGLLVFAACARYNAVPDRSPGIMDNGGGGIQNNRGLDGTDLNRNSTGGDNWNTNQNNGPNNGLNNNLNR